jgi:hypothetical protein
MTLDINGILDVIVSHAQNSGYFQTVAEHESKKSTTTGLTAAVWVERIDPIKSSGLNSASVRVELEMRIYSSTYQEPYDDIDSNITEAVDALFTAYIGDFELGGEARHIDIFGAHGQGLGVRVGYMNMDGSEYRVFQIRIPIIINDAWSEAP